MAIRRGLNVTVRDSLFDPDRSGENVAQIRRSTHGKSLYRVFLYLDGPDLPFVRRVTYRLHETFDPNTRTMDRTVSNPRCKLDIWTWGVFTVRAVVEDKQGRTFAMSHHLEYGSHLNEPDIEFKST